MPFRSEAERKYLWAHHPEVAREFEEHTPKGAKLPARVGKMTAVEPDEELLGKRKMAEGGFSAKEAARVARDKGAHVDPKKLARGMNVELEHRKVTHGDALPTAQIALDHLKERADYYERLKRVEQGGEIPLVGKCADGKIPLVRRKKRGPLIGKLDRGVSHAGGPAYPYGRQTLPDYQDIYNVVPSKQVQRQDAKEATERRRASAARNAGRFGFHGEPPKPVLRNERGAFNMHEPGKSGQLRTKPTVLPPLIFKPSVQQARGRLEQRKRVL